MDLIRDLVKPIKIMDKLGLTEHRIHSHIIHLHKENTPLRMDL